MEEAMPPQEESEQTTAAEAPSTDGQEELVEDDDDDEVASTATSKSKPGLRFVPLVGVELENVTYAPATLTASSNSRRRKRHKDATPQKVILDHVSTTVSPYQLSAWMGPSGSGKTSLITVAAGLYEKGDLQPGSIIKVNDEEGSIPKRLTGVVWQDDLLLANLTVEETIYFSAKLKTPSSTPDKQVHELVEETMQELGLIHVRDSLIGSTTSGQRGISGGERKRVSVASELVVNPSVLFLDEPTVSTGSGQDGWISLYSDSSHTLLPHTNLNTTVWSRFHIGTSFDANLERLGGYGTCHCRCDSSTANRNL